MHQFWTIPEVASTTYLQLSRRDCARLARVHSAIWPSVVHLVWAKVPQISCLSNLLPDVDFRDYNALSTQIPLTERQWTRFDIHAKFIKDLKVGVRGHDELVLMLLQKLWAQRPSGSPRSFIHAIKNLTVVLPNTSSTLSSTSEWSLLFSETLLSFNLTFRAVAMECFPEENLVSCLEALPTCSPNLQSMTLQVGRSYYLFKRSTQLVVETIRALDKLTSVGLDFTPFLPQRLVDEVLSTHRLSYMYLSDVSGEEHEEEAPTARPTPQTLTAVGLSGGPRTMARLLKSIDPSAVRKLVVKDSGLEMGRPFETSGEMLDALGRFSELEKLDLDLIIESFSTLLSLRDPLQRLVRLSIGPSSLATGWISQQTLPQFAALLPRIEDLRILDEGLDSELTTVSLQALQCLAVSCPHLRKLRIPILAESVTGTTNIQPHPSVREVDFRHSTVDEHSDTEAVARTIAAMFPSLVSFGYLSEDDIGIESDDSNAEPWEDVVGALVQILPGLTISVLDDDEWTVGSFGDFFSDVLKMA
ncbi:hypothetical protein FRC04_006905 [Tulasnella sp. 424]|nr:hypothetical protein FRC04_006905 [Tulasnella sp. 424]KAG8974411.1 hypothetical protein FRC05_007572 [Tulasnella sp. 425]